MSRGCGYCDRPGHRIDVCPERLEDKYGTVNDPTETGKQLTEEDDDDG